MTPKSETQIRIAAKLYEARDAVRTLLGDKYHEKMKIGMDALQTLCDEEGISPLVAATRTANMFDREGRGAAALLVLAAAVEMLEPSA
jgi:hypothetical protein